MDRRQFTTGCLAAMSAAGYSAMSVAQEPAEKKKPDAAPKRPRIAAINSIYRLRSHAYHIAGRFLFGYTRNGFHHQPPFQLVRMYNHQYPPDDLSRSVCPKYNVELCTSVAQTLGGSNGLDVNGVLLIVEHGDYPTNERGQILYPRYELFQEVVSFFEKSGKTAPIFCDKHLSYDYDNARRMVQTARRMGFRMFAGSSVPVTWRIPEIEPPLNTPFKESLVAFGYDRSLPEVYFFHALEALQCMHERRIGGETGVTSVSMLEGDAVWKAGDEGLWSWQLLNAAINRNPSKNYGNPREQVLRPQAILIEYADGTRGAALNLIEAVSDFSFAASVEGMAQPLSTSFFLPPPPGANFFNPLTFQIERFFQGEQPYPVERTLLTSTILDLALRAAHGKIGKIKSDALDVRYQPPADTGFFRGPHTDAV